MRKNTMIAMSAIPMMGPTTAPAIHALDLDLELFFVEPGDVLSADVLSADAEQIVS
jgi:hypothetical protein